MYGVVESRRLFLELCLSAQKNAGSTARTPILTLVFTEHKPAANLWMVVNILHVR